jgi:hypothetical protein
MDFKHSQRVMSPKSIVSPRRSVAHPGVKTVKESTKRQKSAGKRNSKQNLVESKSGKLKALELLHIQALDYNNETEVMNTKSMPKRKPIANLPMENRT